MFNSYELDSLFEKVEELRKEVKENTKVMEYYDYLKEINKGDQLYGWMFTGDAIMNDGVEELDLYQNAYIRDVLTVYKNELENILIKVGL